MMSSTSSSVTGLSTQNGNPIRTDEGKGENKTAATIIITNNNKKMVCNYLHPNIHTSCSHYVC